MAILKVVGASWMQTKVSSYILGILGVLAILALFIGRMERIQEDGNYAATVFYSEKTGYRIEYWGQSNKLEEIDRGVARAHFKVDMDITGWSLLEIETDGSYPDEVQAYAAGIVEGALTWYLIHTHIQNTISTKCAGKSKEKQCDKLKDALEKSANNWRTKASSKGEDDPFWHHVYLHYMQINGIYTGWKHGIDRSMNEFEADAADLYWLNSVSEVMEMQQKLNINLDSSPLDFLPHLSSSYLRVVNASEDGIVGKKLFIAQNAAGSYSSMTRILKRYQLNYHVTSNSSDPTTGVSVEFSGYPGSVTSQDSFYLISGRNHSMAVVGTPLRNFNSKLIKDINFTEQVPLAPRISAANHLSANASSWAHVIARSNSGTGSKQWLVVDFNRFHRLDDKPEDGSTAVDNASETNVTSNTGINGTKVYSETIVDKNIKHTIVYRTITSRAKGLLHLVEQAAGRTHSADVSDLFVEQQYWASYGLPFFQDISEITHIARLEERYGDAFSFTKSPRALMFKEGYKNATTFDSILKFMRQNNLTEATKRREHCKADDVVCIVDQYSALSALGFRADLTDVFHEPFGVIDTKVLCATAKHPNVSFVAISAPPYDALALKNSTDALNKGNIASVYTDKPIDNLENAVEEIRLNREAIAIEFKAKVADLIPPYCWTNSTFVNRTHVGLPDRWDFALYRPFWSW